MADPCLVASSIQDYFADQAARSPDAVAALGVPTIGVDDSFFDFVVSHCSPCG
jgi:hypothetical protein